MPESFEEFMLRRETASLGYIRGDPSAVAAMLTTEQPATFMPPSGLVVQDAEPVRQAHLAGAAAFGPTSTGHFEVLSSGADGSLGYWTGRQVATVHLRGQDEPIPMVLRTTEIFRLQDGEWRLIHRHADIPADAAGDH